MSRSLIRGAAAAGIVALLGALVPAATVLAVALPTLPTLEGESLNYIYDQPWGPTNHIVITQTCDSNGISTIEFDGAGLATGPYPGTFEASGTATVGPHTPMFMGWSSAPGALLTFDETFHISSPVGDVTGTKTLSALVPGRGACFDVDQSAPLNEPPFYNEYGYLYDADGTMAYDATIHSATATLHDAGTNYSNVSTIRICYEYGDPAIDQGCAFGIGIDESNFVSSGVITPAQATQNLIAAIEGLGLPAGVATGLGAQLGQASTLLTDNNPNNDAAACGKLDAFMSQVKAKAKVGQLSPGQADQLLQAANVVKASLGCL